MLPRSICIVAFVRASFLFMAENIPLYGQTMFLHSSGDGHAGCSHLLVTGTSIVMLTGGQVLVWVSIFNSFGYIPKGGCPGWYSDSNFEEWQFLFSIQQDQVQGPKPSSGKCTQLDWTTLTFNSIDVHRIRRSTIGFSSRGVT